MAEIARQAKDKPALRLTAWSEAARLFGKAHETGNSNWSWTETERAYKSLPQKAREKLPEEAIAAAAAAHFALGGTAMPAEVRAYVRGTREPDRAEYDVVVHAINERYMELHRPERLPYGLEA